MLIKPGEKIHIIQRRLFETDVRRHFIGEVVEAGESALRVRGYVFAFDARTGQYTRHSDERERIISLVDASVIMTILPQNAKCDRATYTRNKDNHLCVTDGESFSLDINEFGARN